MWRLYDTLTFIASCLHSHSEDCVLIASGSDLFYHSLHDNKILRKFRGHSGNITNISMCPANDSFLAVATMVLSGECARSVAFTSVPFACLHDTLTHDILYSVWTLQEAGCVAKMELPAGAVATGAYGCFDGSGLVFGIMASGQDENYVNLYDARNYSGGAFSELKLSHASMEAAIQKQADLSGNAAELSKKQLTSLSFNASGNQLLLTGQDGLALLLDGFASEATIQQTLCSPGGVSACFTPDDKTVLMGNKDGTISCWSVETGSIMKKLGGHTGPVSCIAANPTKEMFAAACTSTALWLW